MRLFIAKAQMADYGVSVIEARYEGLSDVFETKRIKWMQANDLIESLTCYQIGGLFNCLSIDSVNNILERINNLLGNPSSYDSAELAKDSIPCLIDYMHGCPASLFVGDGESSVIIFFNDFNDADFNPNDFR